MTATAARAEDDAAALITVTGSRDAGYLATATSTATRTDTPLLDVPQSVSVLTRDRLDDQAMLTIADALRYVPGATTGQGEGHRDQIVLRGNSSTADFFVDGMRDDVQFYRDFYNIERLEILKGPNAMVFGRGGGGGIVNRVTKTPQAQGFVAADAALDTFGAWRLGADINAPLAKGAAARLNAVYEDGANHRQVYDLQRWAVNPTLGFDLAGKGNLEIGYEHADDNRVVDRGVPSADGRPLTGYRDTFFGERQVNRATLNADIASLAADYALTETLTIRQRARYGDYDKFYRNLFPATPVVAGRFNVEAYQDAVERQNAFSQTDLVWKTATGSVKHTLLAGLELGRQISRGQRLQGYFSPVLDTVRANVALTDPFAAPVPVFRPGSVGTRNFRTRADVFGVFVQDQIAIGAHVQVIAGLRHDRFHLDYTDRLTGTGFARTDNLWSPRLGLIVKPVAAASLYASYSRSYLPQSGDQFSSLDATTAALEPERFVNLEVGGKWDVTPGLNLTAALYRLTRNNTRAAGPLPGTIVLTGETRSQGLELAANGILLPNWQVSAGLAFQDAEIRHGTTAAPAGRKVALVPRTQASVWTRYDVSERIGVGVGASHQGRSFANISNAVVLPAYTRVDAAVFVNIVKGIDAQVNVENLFNTGYFPTAQSDNNITTGGPRAARFTLRTRF
ncbi:MAG: TonB-dependent siderophore receptor [Sandarakinorhabdus sp.]|nr:TonB-dependent siderophore receptor [Sandarakinorhabdus sp.]